MARAVVSGAIRRPLELTQDSCGVGRAPTKTKPAAMGSALDKREFRQAVRSSPFRASRRNDQAE